MRRRRRLCPDAAGPKTHGRRFRPHVHRTRSDMSCASSARSTSLRRRAKTATLIWQPPREQNVSNPQPMDKPVAGAYKDAVDNLIFLKKEQFQVSYYTWLLLAAIYILSQNATTSNETWNGTEQRRHISFDGDRMDRRYAASPEHLASRQDLGRQTGVRAGEMNGSRPGRVDFPSDRTMDWRRPARRTGRADARTRSCRSTARV
jgi:hypothetical protein